MKHIFITNSVEGKGNIQQEIINNTNEDLIDKNIDYEIYTQSLRDMPVNLSIRGLRYVP